MRNKIIEVIQQGKKAVKKEYDMLTNENFHGDAIRLICEYYDNKKAIEIMEHVNVLHDIFGHLPRALGEVREMAWDMVKDKFYQDFVNVDIWGQDITTEYTQKDDFFEFTCPYCGKVHKIDKDFYIYNDMKNKKAIQEKCFYCNELLYMEYSHE